MIDLKRVVAMTVMCISLAACILEDDSDTNGDGVPDGILDPNPPAPPPPPAPAADPDVTSENLGAAGGSIDSSDGLFHITVPAGALNSTIFVSIERFDRTQVDGDVEALTPINGYDFTAPPMDLDAPADIEFERPPAEIEADGTTTAEVFPATFQTADGTLTGLEATTEINGATGEVTTHAVIDVLEPGLFSLVALDTRYDPALPPAAFPAPATQAPPLTTSFDYPRSLQVGERAAATFSFEVGSAENPLAFEFSVGVRFRLLKPQVSGDVDILQADSESMFNLGSRDGQRAFSTPLEVRCVREGRAAYVFEAAFLRGIAGLFTRDPNSLADPALDRLLGVVDGNLTIRLRTVEIECRAAPPAQETFTPVGPPSTVDVVFGPIDIPGIEDDGMSVIAAGTGGAVALVRDRDGYSTGPTFDFSLVPGANTLFNAGTLLYPASGTGDPTLLLSQNTVRSLLQPLDAVTGTPLGDPVFVQGTDGGFGPVGLFNRDDPRPTEFYERTSSRFVGSGTDPGGVQVRRLAPDGRSTEVLREVALPSVADEQLSTAAMLGVVPTSDLRYVLYQTLTFDNATRITTYRLRLADYTGAAPVSILIDTLGNNSQRLVCDASSGLCAVSNCASSNDFVQVYRWQGDATVQVGPRVAVPVSCAFGIDVRGDRIVVAGFNDAAYSVGTVDFANGLVTTFAPSKPLPSGCGSPNGLRLLNDAEVAMVVSCGGSSPGVARVPRVLQP